MIFVLGHFDGPRFISGRSIDKKVNPQTFTVLFVKQRNWQLLILVFVISTRSVTHSVVHSVLGLPIRMVRSNALKLFRRDFKTWNFSTFQNQIFVKSSVKTTFLFSCLIKSHWKCSDHHIDVLLWYPQMFISITDFYTEETDDAHILITSINAMGQPEETKRFDKSNYDYRKWNQVGYLAPVDENTCHSQGSNGASYAISIFEIKNRITFCIFVIILCIFVIDHDPHFPDQAYMKIHEFSSHVIPFFEQKSTKKFQVNRITFGCFWVLMAA